MVKDQRLSEVVEDRSPVCDDEILLFPEQVQQWTTYKTNFFREVGEARVIPPGMVSPGEHATTTLPVYRVGNTLSSHGRGVSNLGGGLGRRGGLPYLGLLDFRPGSLQTCGYKCRRTAVGMILRRAPRQSATSLVLLHQGGY